MTKQKEIWQGVARIILGTDEPFSKVTNVMQYLSANNVVIKEDRVLPVTDEHISWSDVANRGYVATESLLEV